MRPIHQLERGLIARCRTGAEDALVRVYAEYGRQVFRYAYHLLGNVDDADDVKQETFLRAFRSIGTFRSECALRTWLLRICANLCRDRIRSCASKLEVLYDPLTTADWSGDTGRFMDPHSALEQAEMAGLLRKALSGMPVEQREIIVLRDVEELSCEEIAVVLGCSRTAVKVRTFRARRRLQERITALVKE